METISEPLPRPVPGALFGFVKLASYLELALFGTLLVFWLLPGFDRQTFIFGLAHGLGYIALCLLILAAILRREAPWPLLAATLTPAGPVGSVIGIALIERRGWGVGGPRSRRLGNQVLTPGAETVDNPPGGETT